MMQKLFDSREESEATDHLNLVAVKQPQRWGLSAFWKTYSRSRMNEMKNVLFAAFLTVALALTVTASGCASSGGGYGGSDGHAGHSH